MKDKKGSANCAPFFLWVNHGLSLRQGIFARRGNNRNPALGMGFRLEFQCEKRCFR